MTVFEIGKLYRWPEKDSYWTLYDNAGKWTNRTLSHQDVFLVLYFKNDIDFLTIKVLISNGIIGYININKSYESYESSVRKFVKLQ